MRKSWRKCYKIIKDSNSAEINLIFLKISENERIKEFYNTFRVYIYRNNKMRLIRWEGAY